VIPISVGYLGLENVIGIVKGNGSGFSLGFRTLPFLFQQWGDLMAAVASLMWFGVLFFAGVTSSLAMGLPFIGLMRDNFKWSSSKTTIAFGIAIFALGFLPVFYFNEGGMGEYDYWAGAVSLVLFACLELILFAWIFGMERGWAEINEGSDMKLPILLKYVIQYITPCFLIAILVGNIGAWYENLTNPDTKFIQWVARGVMVAVLLGIMWVLKVAEGRKKMV
jgi:SNF family Na+-dependent transporter